jgi:hypothetical protein
MPIHNPILITLITNSLMNLSLNCIMNKPIMHPLLYHFLIILKFIIQGEFNVNKLTKYI